MNHSPIIESQKKKCEAYGSNFVESDPNMIVGVADNFFKEEKPLNGLRHPEEGDTTGWYLWAGGEPSTDPDFFKPVHLKHLVKSRPEVIPYLGLAPGWRFLIDPSKDYEDVWEDSSLLDE